MEPFKTEANSGERPNPQVEMGRKRKKKRTKRLDWGEGLFRWTSFQAEHGKGVVPEDYNDKELLQWVQDQRVDYWKMKAGKPSFLDEHGFGMLTRRGFEWGPKPNNDLGEDKSKKPKLRHKSKPKNPTPSLKVPPALFKASSKELVELPSVATTLPQNDEVSSTLPNRGKMVPLSVVSPEKPPGPVAPVKEYASNLEREERKAPPNLSPCSPERLATESGTCPAEQKKVPTPAGPSGSAEAKRRPDDNNTSETETVPFEVGVKPAAEKSRPLDTSTATPEPQSKRPRRHSRSHVSAKEAASLVGGRRGNEVQTGEELYSGKGPQTERYPRRSTRSTVPERLSDKSSLARPGRSRAALAGSKYCLLEIPEFDGIRLLKKVAKPSIERLVPHEEEQALFDEVINESPDLLTCEEKLIFKKGDPYSTFRSNIAWEQRFFEFLVFKRVCGHGRVPKSLPENEALGRWTARNRQYRSNGDPILSKSRIERLDAAGFEWNLGKDHDVPDIQESSSRADSENWDTKLKMLLDYKKRYGDCLVPCGYKENVPLAQWVINCRKQYKNKCEGKRSTLTKKREKQLRGIGFVFSLKGSSEYRKNVMIKAYQKRWEVKYQRLVEFRNTYGHAGVPQQWEEDRSLGDWCHRQRCLGRRYLKGDKAAMPPERFEKLRDIDFPFSSRHLKPLVAGTQFEKEPSKKIPCEASAAPDVPMSSTTSVLPQPCSSSPAYPSRRWKSTKEDGDSDDATEKDLTEGDEQQEVETEEDLTEEDDSDGEEHGEDEDSFAAARNKAVSETEGRTCRNEKRRSNDSLCVTDSSTTKSEWAPDCALSCAVVRSSKALDGEAATKHAKERNWSCEKCGQNGFDFFVEAMDHQARCIGLQSLAIGPVTPLQ